LRFAVSQPLRGSIDERRPVNAFVTTASGTQSRQNFVGQHLQRQLLVDPAEKQFFELVTT